jgi:hypothetical protein
MLLYLYLKAIFIPFSIGVDIKSLSLQGKNALPNIDGTPHWYDVVWIEWHGSTGSDNDRSMLD